MDYSLCQDFVNQLRQRQHQDTFAHLCRRTLTTGHNICNRDGQSIIGIADACWQHRDKAIREEQLCIAEPAIAVQDFTSRSYVFLCTSAQGNDQAQVRPKDIFP